jgi:hypothetical protein
MSSVAKNNPTVMPTAIWIMLAATLKMMVSNDSSLETDTYMGWTISNLTTQKGMRGFMVKQGEHVDLQY